MSDLIERQAAIDELKRISFSHWFECGEYLSEDIREIEIINSKKALEVIEALPSAQPEIVRCKECANYDTDWTPEMVPDRHYCFLMDGMMPKDGFCHRAERRTDSNGRN